LFSNRPDPTNIVLGNYMARLIKGGKKKAPGGEKKHICWEEMSRGEMGGGGTRL